jgi:hypothetical protein
MEIFRTLPPAVGRCLAIAAILFVCAMSAPGQVQKQSLIAAIMTGDEVAATIDLGGTSFPPTDSNPYPYPVNTLVYPDGQVIFRIESWILRQEVTQMQTGFSSGTKFRIATVALKSDLLELKLIARNKETARLKLVLGPAWQTRMSNQAVLAVLHKFLIAQTL